MRRTETGFTVVEVLVALVFMALAFTGIVMMGVTTMAADTQGRGISAATALAREKLEELRTTRHVNAGWGVGTHTETGLYEDGSASGGPYDREWTVEEDYNNFNNLWRVTVTVTWPNGEVSLSSLYR